MGIVRIDTPGIKVRVEGESVIYPDGAKVMRVPLRTLRAIIVTQGISLTTDLIIRAAKNNVFIIVTDFHGNIIAYFVPKKYRGNVPLQREQVRSYDDYRGVHLAKTWAKASVMTRVWLLEYLAKNRRDTELGEKLLEYKARVEQHLDELETINGKLDEIRNLLNQIEMRAANIYFDAIKMIIPKEYGFVARKYPAQDIANATISYANSLVRTEILLRTLITGFNPVFGYLHADANRYNLVLDISEEFIVPIAHLTAIKLLERKQIRKEQAIRTQRGIGLDRPARQNVIAEIQYQLERRIGSRKVKTMIKNQVERLARYLLKQEKTYDIQKLLI